MEQLNLKQAIGTVITGTLYLRTGSLEVSSAKKVYFKGVGCTKNHSVIEIRCWETVTAEELFECIGDVIDTNGILSEFNGKVQFRLNSFTVVEEANILDFVKTANVTFKELEEEMLDVLPEYKEIVDTILIGKVKDLFEVTPAASYYHDNCICGLLNHTVKGLKLIKALGDIYKLDDVRYSLIKVAYCLHDVGKIVEIKANLEYSVEGSKLGHAFWSLFTLDRERDKIRDLIGRENFITILSCIAYHHGEFDGRKPTTVEGYFVHFVDLIESQLTAILQVEEDIRDKTSESKDVSVKFNDSRVLIKC